MGTIQKFEDIDAWQKARALTREIYAMTADGAFAKDFGLRDQIRRAAVSVIAAVFENLSSSFSLPKAQRQKFRLSFMWLSMPVISHRNNSKAFTTWQVIQDASSAVLSAI